MANQAVAEEETTDVGADAQDQSPAADAEPSKEMIAKAEEIMGISAPPQSDTDEEPAAQEKAPAKADKKADVPKKEPEAKQPEAKQKSGKDAEDEFAALSWRRQQAANRMGWTPEYLESLGEGRDAMLDAAADGLDAISRKMAEAGRAGQATSGEDAEGADSDLASFDPDTPFSFEDAEDTFDDATK